MVEIKICGITNLEDALKAQELGADYIGFVFYEKSPRNIAPELAKYISQRVNGVKKVGLFVNENPRIVRDIANFVGLDVLQFHGKTGPGIKNSETPSYCSEFNDIEVWKAFRVKDIRTLSAIPDYRSIDAVLLDAYVKGVAGGTGETFDWELAQKVKGYGKKIVLAGGLNPSNVREAILKVTPFAVDVSTGVEKSKGKKDHEKMKAFIEAARNTPSVLLDIVEKKQAEVKELYDARIDRQYVKGAKEMGISTKSFHKAVSAARTTPSPNLIAEFKITSPSNVRAGNPDYRPNAVPEEIAKIYEENWACAMSVLTDARFKGELDYLRRISKVVDLPLLRKDFIIDPIQIVEARYYGADAVLLIAAILEEDEIKELSKLANFFFGMDCLVESHNREELEKSLAADAKIIGINNRNLHDFNIDRNTTLELLEDIPKDKVVVTESGILTYEHAKELSDPRINAMLVGTTLMKAPDIPEKMHELQGL